ncbi:unnamed protein product [Clonostachys byssicola]|uniref:Uncharacterized protein n=1 Tax=Clonostachys byssicola TaxID=160290 RepID=A0A9N9U079_9HYPO|nr:unnamed protein product [Clonostachys byssicola]
MPAQQPYLQGFQGDTYEPTFDPKAVTRASWEPKPRKPKPKGPLVSFNRHPDAHMVLQHRSGNYKLMGPRTKKAIRYLRRVQLFLRVLELNGALGILVLMVLLDKIETVTALVMRITPGIVALNCCYAIYHLSRDAASRPPSSSSAYQLFSGVADMCTLGLYAYSAFTVHNDSAGWVTRLSDQGLLEYFIPAIYYTLIGTGGLHFLTLAISLWLAYAFRQISLMPPDMNPLEDHLTARPFHKRNKSSMTTLASGTNEKRMSTPYSPDSRRQSVARSDVSRPTSIPFMHTREGSRTSLTAARMSRDLQGSLDQEDSLRRGSVLSHNTKLPSFRSLPSQRGAYSEVPLQDDSAVPPRLGTSSSSQEGGDQRRVAKFTETWAPTDSLISRTNQKNRNAAVAMRQDNRNTYAALEQRYYGDEDSESDYENYHTYAHDSDQEEMDLARQHRHPNPLGSNPQAPSHAKENEPNWPFHPPSDDVTETTLQRSTSLSEMSHNQRKASASQDITEQTPSPSTSPKRKTWQPRKYTPVQTTIGFYSKPYGDLKSATPPIMVGADRKISSGNDFESNASQAYGRRNVSGKIAEEGRAGGSRLSKYGFYSNKKN